MASVANLKPVQKVAEDDGVRERHGVTNSDTSYVEANEDGHLVTIIARGSLTASVTVSPKKARYLASRLYRLARRIEKRELSA